MHQRGSFAAQVRILSYSDAPIHARSCTPDPSSANTMVEMHSCCVWSIIKAKSLEPSNAI